MSNDFFSRAVVASLLSAVAMSVGCNESPTVPSPATSSTPPPRSAPNVTAVSPSAGLSGDTVRVTGAGFVPGAILTFDGIGARVVGTSSDFINALTPLHASGTVDIAVTNPSGQRAMLIRGYTYEVVTLTANSAVVTPGAERLSVSWLAPGGRPKLDWIALIKVGDPSTTYEKGWWDYTNGATSGTLTLSAPTQQGEYEFRYLVDDGFIEVARSSPVTVVSGSPSPLIRVGREGGK